MVRFHLVAEVEMNKAADWYEDREIGLGSRLLEVIDQATDVLDEFPLIAPQLDPRPGNPELRQYSLQGFPFVLVYQPKPSVYILAVVHTSRLPGYWLDRLEDPAK